MRCIRRLKFVIRLASGSNGNPAARSFDPRRGSVALFWIGQMEGSGRQANARGQASVPGQGKPRQRGLSVPVAGLQGPVTCNLKVRGYGRNAPSPAGVPGKKSPDQGLAGA